MSETSVSEKKYSQLIHYCLSHAKELLAKDGRFHPFGAAMRPNEKLIAYDSPGGGSASTGDEIAGLLVDSFKKDFASGDIIAAALTVKVDIPLKYKIDFYDGIRVSLECEEYSRDYFLPYSKQGPIITYGDMFAMENDPWLLRG